MGTDIAEQYALGQNDKRVLARDFDPSFHDASIAGSKMGHLTKQFPFILELMKLLPDNLAILMNPAVASYVKLQRVSNSGPPSAYSLTLSTGHQNPDPAYLPEPRQRHIQGVPSCIDISRDPEQRPARCREIPVSAVAGRA